MDRVADFLLDVDLPVVFRPFHENTGAFFWWGTKSSTPAQYKAAWNYTTDYIVKTRHVHNLLLAYAPSKPGQTAASWELAYGSGPGSTYPGDDRVDIPCFVSTPTIHIALLLIRASFQAQTNRLTSLPERVLCVP